MIFEDVALLWGSRSKCPPANNEQLVNAGLGGCGTFIVYRILCWPDGLLLNPRFQLIVSRAGLAATVLDREEELSCEGRNQLFNRYQDPLAAVEYNGARRQLFKKASL